MIHFFKNYIDILEKPISNVEVNDLYYYLNKGWYLQILKEFGITIVLILIKYFEKQEEFITCKNLVETIENSNKYFGTYYPLTLEKL